MNANAEIIAELRRVLNERDEAREQLDLTKRELGRWVDRETKAARERDEARTSCPDCAMWAERAARWHDDMQRAERERDEARAELSKLRKDYDSVLEANVSLLDGAPYVTARAAFRRGAEAMREACAQWFREHDESFELTVDACHDVIADMPIPEEP